MSTEKTCSHKTFYDDFQTNDRICVECGVVLGSAFGVQLFGGDNKESRWAGFAPIRRGRGLAFKVCGYNPVSTFSSNFKSLDSRNDLIYIYRYFTTLSDFALHSPKTLLFRIGLWIKCRLTWPSKRACIALSTPVDPKLEAAADDLLFAMLQAGQISPPPSAGSSCFDSETTQSDGGKSNARSLITDPTSTNPCFDKCNLFFKSTAITPDPCETGASQSGARGRYFLRTRTLPRRSYAF